MPYFTRPGKYGEYGISMMYKVRNYTRTKKIQINLCNSFLNA